MMGENGRKCVGDDKIIRFVSATAHGKRFTSSLIWWCSNAWRYSTGSGLARNLLAVQATSFANKSQLSPTTGLISGRRGCLKHGVITTCMCV